MDSTAAPLITPNVVGMEPSILPFSLHRFWYVMGLEGDLLQRGPQTQSRDPQRNSIDSLFHYCYQLVRD